MKISTIILPAALILLLLVTGVFVPNISSKKKYNKVNKSNFCCDYEATDVFAKYGF